MYFTDAESYSRDETVVTERLDTDIYAKIACYLYEFCDKQEIKKQTRA